MSVSVILNTQVSIMKVLASYPNGLAKHDDLKRDLELLATSGVDWAVRSKQLGKAFPSLDIFSLGLVERYSFGWRLTRKGSIVLEMMEEAASPPIVSSMSRLESTASSASAAMHENVPRGVGIETRLRFAGTRGGKSEAA